MHASAVAHIELCVRTYLSKDQHYRVLDLGSWARPHEPTHRDLLAGHRFSYLGVDLVPGHNVDRVMKKPFQLPARSCSIDLVISGQVLEHVTFPWATMAEVQRVLCPGGLAFIVAPSRGHPHNVQDLWRFYPDGMRALAAYAGLELLEAHTDFPPSRENGAHDYSRIEPYRYWGDTVGVFRRPNGRLGVRALAVRALLTAWANRTGDIGEIPRPDRLPARGQWHLTEQGRPRRQVRSSGRA